MFDGEAFGAEVVAQVRGFVEKATAELRKEVDELRAALAERPQAVTHEQIAEMVKDAAAALPAPKDGESVDHEAVKAIVDEAVSALPKPEDGKSFTAEDAAPLIAEEVARAVAAIPAAEPGKDADPVTADQIEDAVLRVLEPVEGREHPVAVQVRRWMEMFPPALDATPEQIAEAVQRHLEANPIKTLTVEDIAPVVAEAVAAIPQAKDGEDAAQIASFVKDHTGSLIVTLSDGRVIDTGIRDGAKGDPGRDALTLEDFDTELSEDGRILTLSLENGETRVTHELQLPVMIYRGGFKEGVEYVEGDTVTFGGSLWCCSAPTTDKPAVDQPCWRLAARKGRDGKDAKAPA